MPKWSALHRLKRESIFSSLHFVRIAHDVACNAQRSWIVTANRYYCRHTNRKHHSGYRWWWVRPWLMSHLICTETDVATDNMAQPICSKSETKMWNGTQIYGTCACILLNASRYTKHRGNRTQISHSNSRYSNCVEYGLSTSYSRWWPVTVSPFFFISLLMSGKKFLRVLIWQEAQRLGDKKED